MSYSEKSRIAEIDQSVEDERDDLLTGVILSARFQQRHPIDAGTATPVTTSTPEAVETSTGHISPRSKALVPG